MRRLDHDEVQAVLPADPRTVYTVVADVTRTPQWSPEVVDCAWLDGARGPKPGVRFAARNRKRWFSWTNRPVITVVEPAHRFAFERTEHGGGTIEWSYELQPQGTGTLTTLSYRVTRPVPIALHVILRLTLGVRDLRADLHDNMTASLRRLADVVSAEAGRTAAP